MAQSAALVAAPLFGLPTDRINRVTALSVSLVITAVGFTYTILITNPYSPYTYITAVLIGMGEIRGVITSGVLIAQQAPHSVRGSVIGFLGIAGAIGILIGFNLGGFLFYNWTPAAPLFLFGLLAFLVLIWSLLIKHNVVPPSDVD